MLTLLYPRHIRTSRQRLDMRWWIEMGLRSTFAGATERITNSTIQDDEINNKCINHSRLRAREMTNSTMAKEFMEDSKKKA